MSDPVIRPENFQGEGIGIRSDVKGREEKGVGTCSEEERGSGIFRIFASISPRWLFTILPPFGSGVDVRCLEVRGKNHFLEM